MLQAVGLACLKGDRLLFRDLSLALEQGAILRVAGANGCGKSSLLRILCGLSSPESGQVLWQGKPIRKQRDIYHGQLLYLGHAPGLNERLNPKENLQFSCASAGDTVSAHDIEQALTNIGLAAQADLALNVLSQGQRKRVGLARLFLARQRSLWILDEPFSALDSQAVAKLSEHIESHCAAGGMVILTTHQEVPFTRAIQQLDIGGYA